MESLYCFGIGIGTKNNGNDWLEVLFPKPLIHLSPEDTLTVKSILGNETKDIDLDSKLLKEMKEGFKLNGTSALTDCLEFLSHENSSLVATIMKEDEAPTSVPQAYLKLQLLSHRCVKPNELNLDGIFGVLKNLAWTSDGPIDLRDLPNRMILARNTGKLLSIFSVDKFPPMLNYVVPDGVRIADGSRVRLGAYLGKGTTVMHEGFINFNAGTEGTSMVEGRISAGVFCGAGSDIGGGASIMGTLSGGGDIVISVGKQCLLGANSGLGIPLGDRCTVEAGLYITAGTIVTLVDNKGMEGPVLKARELSNGDDLLFRRNSLTGRVECLTNKSHVELNQELHLNN